MRRTSDTRGTRRRRLSVERSPHLSLSVATTASISNLYEKPEQPPDSTPSRKSGESGDAAWIRRAARSDRDTDHSASAPDDDSRRAASSAGGRGALAQGTAGRRHTAPPTAAALPRTIAVPHILRPPVASPTEPRERHGDLPKRHRSLQKTWRRAPTLCARTKNPAPLRAP